MSQEYEEMQVEKWVNLEDVAKHLSISQDTVRTWIKEGKLPYYRAGRQNTRVNFRQGGQYEQKNPCADYWNDSR